MTDFDLLFNPRNIALIGASGTPGKWGFIILLNILKSDYQGKVFPVNPNQDKVLGLKCYKTVEEIPEKVDVAFIATPARFVAPLVDACGGAKIPYLVVITSDFSESGPEGAAREKEIVEKAAQYGIRIVGPNTMGIFSSDMKLHALMPPVMPLEGPVSMFSQSGNMGTQMLFWGKREGLGFQKFVSSGNEGDLDCEDYLGYFAEDEKTKVIMAYLEGVGVNSKLLSTAKAASVKKPVVVFKGGRTNVGQKAAASHSGAMAGESAIYSAAFKQSGMIEVSSSQEMMDCTKALAIYPPPRGKNVAILTRGGGWGVITADSCEENGLSVPSLPEDIIEKFSQILPKFWSKANPVDMVATIAHKPYITCLETLAQWEGVDSIIALGGGAGMDYEYAQNLTGPKELLDTLAYIDKRNKERDGQPDVISSSIGDLVKKTGKPIIFVSIGSAEIHSRLLKEHDVVAVPTPERAVRILKLMADYSDFLQSV